MRMLWVLCALATGWFAVFRVETAYAGVSIMFATLASVPTLADVGRHHCGVVPAPVEELDVPEWLPGRFPVSDE